MMHAPIFAPNPLVGLVRPPRLGFAGVGCVGRQRLEALRASRAGQVELVADVDPDTRREAAGLAPGALAVASFDELLDRAAEHGLDGVVISTPSALHADQAVAALERGLAVFCQQPLALSGAATRQVLEAARRADRLLGVDLSYRHAEAVRALRRQVEAGALGHLYAGRFAFHSAYGPEQPWFYDRAASGGGCVLDLGAHLIDLALLLFGRRRVTSVRSRLFERGRRVRPPLVEVEDHAAIQLDLDDGAAVDITCSWNAPVGRDALIQVSLFGDQAGAQVQNVAGSFDDLRAEALVGSSRLELVRPTDGWGGRALAEWAGRLAVAPGHDPSVEELAHVADVIDRVYEEDAP